jgi:hypothetical protein
MNPDQAPKQDSNSGKDLQDSYYVSSGARLVVAEAGQPERHGVSSRAEACRGVQVYRTQ